MAFAWILSLLNLWGFRKCHLVAKLEAENVARVLLLDTSVLAFQPATDNNASESDHEIPIREVEPDNTNAEVNDDNEGSESTEEIA
jgi:hypothetical protein